MPRRRTALVTGAASGIGRAIAQRLAGSGTNVVVADVDAAWASAVAAEIGGTAVAFDVSDPEAVDVAFGKISAQVEGLDAYAGAAGIELNRPFPELTVEDWTRVIGTNLTGQFLCLRACLPLLRRQQGAAVVIGSPAAHAAYPGAVAYAASKAGLEGLVRAAAIDLAPLKVRVNALLPGTTATPMLWGAADGPDRDEIIRQAGDAVPLGAVGDPADMAAIAAFLLSDQARYVTGACWVADGGLLARIATDL
jgi:NAD(P)-dependent dehydrogenase (short-subunit alcohol dehydrogenase family)